MILFPAQHESFEQSPIYLSISALTPNQFFFLFHSFIFILCVGLELNEEKKLLSNLPCLCHTRAEITNKKFCVFSCLFDCFFLSFLTTPQPYNPIKIKSQENQIRQNGKRFPLHSNLSQFNCSIYITKERKT